MSDTQYERTTQPAYWFLGAAIFLIMGIVILFTGHRAWGAGELVVGLLWVVVGLRAMRCRQLSAAAIAREGLRTHPRGAER